MSIFKTPDFKIPDWVYTTIGAAALIGLPVFLYYLYFTRSGSFENYIQISGAVESVDVSRRHGDSGENYLEIKLKEKAVPVRMHDPLYIPDASDAPLDARSFLADRPSTVAIHVRRDDLGKLETPPLYPPHRWVEGFSLRSGATAYLDFEAALPVYRKDARGFLYLANAFVFSYAGILLLVLAYSVETVLAEKRGAKKREEVDPVAASGAAAFYRFFIVGLFMLNVPALIYGRGWNFGPGYWIFFTVVVAAMQALLFLHHRKYLSVVTSEPLLSGEVPGGFFSYLAANITLCMMLTPVIMWVYSYFP